MHTYLILRQSAKALDKDIYGHLPGMLNPLLFVQCQAEVTRLEAEQAKVMKVMIQAKSAEIARVCSETCLPVPDLGALVDNVESGQVHLCLIIRPRSCFVSFVPPAKRFDSIGISAT